MIPFFKGPGDLLVQLPYSLLGVDQLVFYAIKVNLGRSSGPVRGQKSSGLSLRDVLNFLDGPGTGHMHAWNGE